MTPLEVTAAKAIGGKIFNRIYHSLFGKTRLAIDYPNWKQRAITVDILNKSGSVARGVRVLLTIEDSEYNLGLKDTDILSEILTDKIKSPFKSPQNPSKINNEPICFAERDSNGRNFQTLDISPKSTRTADIMQVDLRRRYLDIASELGFSTNGGQSRALLIPKKCYVGIITVESHTSKPEHFPVLFLPYSENKPLQQFGGYSFYRLLRDNNIFFGPLQFEELSNIAKQSFEIRNFLINTPDLNDERITNETEFAVYKSKENFILSVVHKNGLGTKIAALLASLQIGQIPFLKVDILEKVGKDLCLFSDRWNQNRNPFFEVVQSRKKINNEIIQYLKNEENWSEYVLNALELIKNRVFNGTE